MAGAGKPARARKPATRKTAGKNASPVRARKPRSARRKSAASKTSLKRWAECSSRRKAGAYRSALSMLTFYINRAGKALPKTQGDRLQRAKTALKHQFHRE